MRKELENLMSIWQMAEEVGTWQKKWLETCWFNMSTDEVASSGSELESKLSEYPAECQNWDITESLIEALNMIREVLPLVEDLSNSSMRARHWKQLYRETKSAIQIDQDTVRYMTLGKLLTTNLHGWFYYTILLSLRPNLQILRKPALSSGLQLLPFGVKLSLKISQMFQCTWKIFGKLFWELRATWRLNRNWKHLKRFGWAKCFLFKSTLSLPWSLPLNIWKFAMKL